MLKYTVDSKKGVQSVQLKKTNKRLFWRHLATKVPTLSKIPVAQTMPHKISSPVETGTLKAFTRQMHTLAWMWRAKTRAALPQTQTGASLFKKQPSPSTLSEDDLVQPPWMSGSLKHLPCSQRKGCIYWWTSMLTSSFCCFKLSNPVYIILTIYFQLV